MITVLRCVPEWWMPVQTFVEVRRIELQPLATRRYYDSASQTVARYSQGVVGNKLKIHSWAMLHAILHSKELVDADPNVFFCIRRAQWHASFQAWHKKTKKQWPRLRRLLWCIMQCHFHCIIQTFVVAKWRDFQSCRRYVQGMTLKPAYLAGLAKVEFLTCLP